MIKNDKVKLEIIDMVDEGLGLAKIDGQVFFVKDAVVGDVVDAVVTKVTKNVIYVKATKILNESKYRVKSKCINANACGGCQLLNLEYGKQLELKKEKVINCLSKIGHIDEISDNIYEGIIGSKKPCHFRNKMQVPFGMKNGKIIYGFYAGRTHYIVPFKYCIVGFKGAEIILDAIKNNLLKHKISIYDEIMHEGIFREVMLRCGNDTHEVSITYIINDSDYTKKIDLYKKFDEDVRNDIINKLNAESKIDINVVSSSLNINKSITNAIFGNENVVIYGKGYINDNIGSVKFQISPESFYQVNMEMTKVLYDKVLEFGNFNENDNVLDLYSGIGTISLYVGRNVKEVLGVEIVDRAVKDANVNAKINGINNAKFLCIDLSKDDIISLIYKNISNINTIIVDPPRKGLDSKTIDLISEIKPKKIIYVSCDPATLARDLDIICHVKTYKLKRIVNVDMFPHTMHVETVALIENN